MQIKDRNSNGKMCFLFSECEICLDVEVHILDSQIILCFQETEF
jgi:hypothetical protein